MSGAHSVIPPSSAFRRRGCPGSRAMEAMFPEDEDSEGAREGAASHELGEILVKALARGEAIPPPDRFVGQPAFNGVVWDRDSYEGAKLYALTVQAHMRAAGSFTPLVEQRVAMPGVHPESWGTPDCVVWMSDRSGVFIVDYKYGRRPVDVYENDQLMEYAAGVLDGVDGLEDQALWVEFTIVQPRAYHPEGTVRRWRVQASDLRAHFNHLSAVEHAAMADDAPTRTGEHCRDCTARHKCEAAQRAGYGIAEYVARSVPVDLTPFELGLELHVLHEAQQVLNARVSGLEAQAEQLIRAGEAVPWYELKTGRGSEVWTVEPDELFMVGDMFGVDFRKPPTPCTPKQAREKLIDANVISGYIKKQPGNISLKPVVESGLARIFSKQEL